MRRSLLAEEGHEFFSFPRFNEPALKVGIHLRVRSVTTLPHEEGIHGTFLTDYATQPLHPEWRGSMHLLSECFT